MYVYLFIQFIEHDKIPTLNYLVKGLQNETGQLCTNTLLHESKKYSENMQKQKNNNFNQLPWVTVIVKIKINI